MEDKKNYKNILPCDGITYYFGVVVDGEAANVYYQKLSDLIDWQPDEVILFGKRHITKRKTAWYGNEPFQYKYSGTTRVALPWTKELLELKKIVEEVSGETYNSCLLNLYHDGSEGMSWHSDDEKMLKKNGAIASLSFGAERSFSFKHRATKQTLKILLEPGSLLVMKGETQQHWLHALPKSSRVKTPRINLTFRTIDK